MRLLWVCLLLLLGSWQELCARSYQEVLELTAIFQREGLPGTFVLLDASSDTVLVSNKARAEQRFTPASTFKIANSLIGLDTGAVKSVDAGQALTWTTTNLDTGLSLATATPSGQMRYVIGVKPAAFRERNLTREGI